MLWQHLCREAKNISCLPESLVSTHYGVSFLHNVITVPFPSNAIVIVPAGNLSYLQLQLVPGISLSPVFNHPL